MTKFSDQTAEFSGAVTHSGLAFGHYTATIAFSDLGSGASDAIALASFPLNAIYLGCAVEVPTTEFTGEADLVFEIGYTGGDTNALVESTALHETDTGFLAVVAGVQHGGTFLADASDDGLAVLFGATELDDVTAGEMVVHIYYAVPVAS